MALFAECFFNLLKPFNVQIIVYAYWIAIIVNTNFISYGRLCTAFNDSNFLLFFVNGHISVFSTTNVHWHSMVYKMKVRGCHLPCQEQLKNKHTQLTDSNSYTSLPAR